MATALSLTGTQIIAIALPWLVLKATGELLSMGLIIAIAAIPRTAFMLVGGAVVDRFAPSSVALVSNVARSAILSGLAWVTLEYQFDRALIMVAAFLLGLADAFGIPAAGAIPARLMKREQLSAANGALYAVAYGVQAIGPLAAGMLIAAFGSSGQGGLEDRIGLTAALGLAAILFALAALQLAKFDTSIGSATGPFIVWSALKSGLRYVWADVPIRAYVTSLALFSLLFRGPFLIGVPAFANAHPTYGVEAMGVTISVLGLGALLGSLLAGRMHRPRTFRWLTSVVLLDFLSFGVVLVAMTLTTSIVMVAVLVLLTGCIDGCIATLFVTWIQRRVPPDVLGRVLSVVALCIYGSLPISVTLAALLAKADASRMLAFSGYLVTSLSLAALLAMCALRRSGSARRLSADGRATKSNPR